MEDLDSNIDENTFHFPLENFERECSSENIELSLIYDDLARIIRRRENNTYLRPICIDAMDVSRKYLKDMKKLGKQVEGGDKEFNIRAITLTLLHFISKGHTSVAFLPYNLRAIASKCSNPYELYILIKMDVVMFDDNKTQSSDELAKNIATCTSNSDGCIVGSLKKYQQLLRRNMDIPTTISNGFIRIGFENENRLKINNNVRMSLALNEIQNDGNPLAFQMFASDQISTIEKLALILKDDQVSTIHQMFEPFIGTKHRSNNPSNRNNAPNNLTSNPYHHLDPFLPEYLAPPPPKNLDSKRVSRIGHKNSIYRVGGPTSGTEGIAEINEEDRLFSMKGALIQALEGIFGIEKALQLIREHPEIDEINDLIEFGLV